MTGPRSDSEQADLVLTAAPPLFGSLWLGAGMVRVMGALQQAGIGVRLVRLQDDLAQVPEPVRYQAYQTLYTVPAARGLDDTPDLLANDHQEFLNGLLEPLLFAGEQIFAFAVWSANGTVTGELCRQLKQRRPECSIILGGPEVIEWPERLRWPWVDALVWGPGERVIAPLARALLDGRPAAASRLARVWINPRHDGRGRATAAYAEDPLEVTQVPTDFTPVVLHMKDYAAPRCPVVLNVGCVYRCGFCTAHAVYPEVQRGAVERCVAELHQIAALWHAAFDGASPPLDVDLCDASLNGDHQQFESLCDAIHGHSWPGELRLAGSLILDKHITRRRLEKAVRAGFREVFCGLESADPRIRRAMGKPGTIQEVQRALQVASEVGGEALKVALSVIVGWPGETEVEHQATVGFLEGYAQLKFRDHQVLANPMFYSPHLRNQAVFASLKDRPSALLWRLEGEAGSPETRCRRLLGIIEHFRGVLRVDSPIPLDLLVKWMLPSLAASIWVSETAHHQTGSGEANRDETPVGAAAQESADEHYGSEPRPVAAAADPAGVDTEAADRAEHDPPAPGEDPCVPREESPVEAARTKLLERLFQLDERYGIDIAVRTQGSRSRIAVRSDEGIHLVELIVEDRDVDQPCYRRVAGYNIMIRGRQLNQAQVALADVLLARLAKRVGAQRRKAT